MPSPCTLSAAWIRLGKVGFLYAVDRHFLSGWQGLSYVSSRNFCDGAATVAQIMKIGSFRLFSVVTIFHVHMAFFLSVPELPNVHETNRTGNLSV